MVKFDQVIKIIGKINNPLDALLFVFFEDILK